MFGPIQRIHSRIVRPEILQRSCGGEPSIPLISQRVPLTEARNSCFELSSQKAHMPGSKARAPYRPFKKTVSANRGTTSQISSLRVPISSLSVLSPSALFLPNRPSRHTALSQNADPLLNAWLVGQLSIPDREDAEAEPQARIGWDRRSLWSEHSSPFENLSKIPWMVSAGTVNFCSAGSVPWITSRSSRAQHLC